jgi:two-component system CheB/CheR fusion protein
MERLREMMSRQVRLISRLVDDLMDAARYARGAIRLQKERVNLTVLLDDVIGAVRPKIEAHAHELHTAFAEEPLRVDGDAVRLNQIFLNILDNAIKYSGRGGEIWISLERQANVAVVRIRDNGPGINAAMLPTVFEMFSQAGTTLDRSAGGLGIGLYLVKQLVELHRGTVEALSDGPGSGTEFVVTLPALARSGVDEGLEPECKSPEAEAGIDDLPLDLPHEATIAHARA